ncbi:MAG: FtsW/RodA/SpoVE family cell cycle protein [Eggerthellaceae bacterium]|nr:FtsW/RodA/SpoVE family cell cycle protein [Eggerthellaceae bacterium]
MARTQAAKKTKSKSTAVKGDAFKAQNIALESSDLEVKPAVTKGEKTKLNFNFFSGPADVAAPRLVIAIAVFFLSVIGLVVVFSASSIEAIDEGLSPEYYVVRQAAIMLIGLILCIIIAWKIPYDIWQKWPLYGAWAGAIALLLLTAAIGTVGLGAQRWVTVAGISGQPSELAKVAFILMAAFLFNRARLEEIGLNKLTFEATVFLVIPLLILYRSQSDLGTTIICAIGIVAVIYFSGASQRIIATIFGGIFVFGILAVAFAGYRTDRLAFLNAEANYYGSGYQLARSFYAFGEGGLFGVGLGNSTEKYLYLPEAETDFIFAIVGEELGLIGALAVVIAFLAILWAGLRIARNAPDLFGTLIAGGCTVMLVFQAFLNIGCVTGVLPTTGKPLPFMSSGGSALIGSFLLVGLILSVSAAQDKRSPFYERRRNDLRVVRSSSAKARK